MAPLHGLLDPTTLLQTFGLLGVAAGAAHLAYRRFVPYNVLGGLLWGVGVTVAGFTLGKVIPSIDRYLLPVIALIVAVSLLPPAVEALRAWRRA